MLGESEILDAKPKAAGTKTRRIFICPVCCLWAIGYCDVRSVIPDPCYSLSLSAATPGSVLPSSSSKLAPPPVEM